MEFKKYNDAVLSVAVQAVVDKIKSESSKRVSFGPALKKMDNALYDEVLLRTRFLDDAYGHVQFRARLACIMNGVYEIPKCHSPGCGNTVDCSKLRYDQPFPQYCSAVCAQRDPCTTERKKKTKFDRYGDRNYCNSAKARRTVEDSARLDSGYYDRISEKTRATKLERYGSASYNNMEKCRATKAARYGNEYFSNREKASKTYAVKTTEEKASIVEKRKATLAKLDRENPGYVKSIFEKAVRTKIEKYGRCNVTNHEKCVKTVESKYGVQNVFQSEDVKNTVKDGNLQKYGCEYYSSTRECRDKVKKTCLDRYGTECVLSDDAFRRKIRDGNIEKHGVEHSWQREDVKAQIRRTNMERYGCEYPAQNPELRKKMRSGYIVYIASTGADRYLPQNERISSSEKLCFDSLPELAFYIWLNDNGYDFEYQPDAVFEYEYAGKKHVYLPDFLVDGMFVELKGDHFFDESGKMINPFRDPSWTDLEYSDECLKYEAKHQCMLDNGVTIMREEQYRKYIDYVNIKYGNDFLKKFKKAFSPVVGK